MANPSQAGASWARAGGTGVPAVEHTSKPSRARNAAVFGACIAVILVIAFVLTRGAAPPSDVRNDSPAPATVRGAPPHDEAVTHASGGESAPPLPVVASSAVPADSSPDERRFMFECGSTVFAVRTIPGQATLFAPQLAGNAPVVLSQTPADSGSRYSDGETSLWIKENVATIELRGQAYVDCAENRFKGLLAHAQAIGDIVWGTGNEPSWTLDIHPQHLTLMMELGAQQAEFPYRYRVEAGEKITYRSTVGTQEIVAVVESRACNDSKSGEAFPAAIAVTFEQRTYYGCAGLFPLNMPRPE